MASENGGLNLCHFQFFFFAGFRISCLFMLPFRGRCCIRDIHFVPDRHRCHFWVLVDG